MNFKKHAVILAVIERLHEHESWTGKTHVQKALSLLHDSGKMEVPFEFILYKHGPYSFDVEEELEQMKSYNAIRVEPNARGYGVVLRPTERAKVISQYPNGTLTDVETQSIEFVCRFVGSRTAVELERLATASWIRTREGVNDASQAADRLHQLKPHVSTQDAKEAYDKVTEWLQAADC